ncbi:DUF805 domain-containing protein [Massilia pseudoviolaceinigra]|uniref:DUF805 domain-containing protein n=1 Tax=Massilia pseudoviolaceinigra TaxID=3057165 RepID=UPI0027968BB9|nr:DUF805 domain-containing protein [Massilia sp. CCM 9206]MDQ1919630.1 DUF805 domain-containing protein [Massilia sp. CCM 9206]
MHNPYLAPQAPTPPAPDRRCEQGIFALTGRIGRLRFFVYSLLPPYVLVALLFMGGIMNSAWPYLTPLRTVLFALTLLLPLVYVMRRLDDLHRARRWGLLYLVPPINFAVLCYLLFAPGDKAANQRGPAPAPNTAAVVLGLLLELPLLLFLAWLPFRSPD